MEKRDILIVDDDRHCLELIGCIIDHLGLEAEYAAGGEEALGILKKASFATMITDLNMPGMDGFELSLLAKGLHPQMEIIMATGAVSPDVFRLAVEIGISRVLQKPYELKQFREILLGKA